MGLEDIALFSGQETHKNCLIYLNGKPIGICQNGVDLCKRFRRQRKQGKINYFVSIYYNPTQNSVYVSSDGGRLIRPLIVVE